MEYLFVFVVLVWFYVGGFLVKDGKRGNRDLGWIVLRSFSWFVEERMEGKGGGLVPLCFEQVGHCLYNTYHVVRCLVMGCFLYERVNLVVR